MKKLSLYSIVALTLISPPVFAQENGIEKAVEEAAAEALESILENEPGHLGDTESEPRRELDPAIRDVFERGCGDDQGKDRCDPKVQARMRELYDLPAIEELAEEGSEVYRTMLIDGYGSDVVAISFVRERGKGPYVDVRAPKVTEDHEQPLNIAVSPDRWQSIAGRSPSFDQKLAHEVLPETETLRMCLHGWVAVVESVEPVSPFVSTTISYADDDKRVSQQTIERPAPHLRRDTESACADGLAVPFAFDLANEAREVLVECANLKLDDFRNSAELLASCQRLRGDRLIAARAIPTSEALQSFRSLGDLEENPFLFIDQEEGAAEQFLSELNGGIPFLRQPNAVSTTDVVLEGYVYYADGNGQEMPTHQASLTVNLHDYADNFSVLSWSVGEKEPFVLPEGLRRMIEDSQN